MKILFSNKGFTLIELMIVIVMMSILLMIAIPSYQHFIRKSWASKAEQAVQDIALQLDRHKARNFNYQGFNYTENEIIQVAKQKYDLSIVDGDDVSKKLTDQGAIGRNWVIKASTDDVRNYKFLMTSTGIKCKNLDATELSFSNCGAGSESW
ncbi:type IV pilin protein [Acinetobacter gerneri]|uniref:type IV pilin protein n=1 Tax=Acinetobacter gerneri TaxID=202952 RepID=UPI00321378D7